MSRKDPASPRAVQLTQTEAAREDKLRESEERYRLLAEQTVDGIFVTDGQGRFVDANRSGCRMLGYSLEEILALGIPDVVTPAERERLGPEVARFAGGRVVRSQWTFQRKDGSVFPGEIVGRQLPDGKLQGILRDISDQKQIEAALRESDLRYRSLFNSIDEGFCIIEVLFAGDNRPVDYRFLEANPAFERHTGLSGAVGRRVLELVPNQDQHWFEIYADIVRSGHPKRFEIRGEALNRFYDVYAFRLGQPAEHKVAVLFRDVSERRQAEERLRESEEQLRKLGDNLPDSAIYQYITKSAGAGRFTYFSAGIEKLTGVKVEDALRDPMALYRLLEPSDLNVLMKEEARCIRQLADFNVEVPMQRTDGEIRWMSIRSRPRALGDGTIVWDGVQTDITERKRVEEALRESEEQLRRAIQEAPIPVIMHAEDGEVLQISKAWTELTGFTPAQVPTVDAWLNRAYGPGADLVRNQVRDLFTTGRRVAGMEIPVLTAEGQTRYWSLSVSSPGALRDGRRFVVGIAVDITEKKEATAVLARDKSELERLVAERTAKLQDMVAELEHFSYTITHDLKSPLRAMRGFAEMASQVIGESEARPFLERIGTAAERMDALIRDALNYSRAVRQELPLEDVDTGALLRGMLDSYPDFQPSKALIRVEGPLPVVLGNEAGLTQCFSNLLGNAVKFVKPGDTPHIRVWAEQRDGWSRIWVEDKGVGIAREMMPRIFDMFSRGSKEYEGTGIGLALVRKVVQKMGGKVGVESEEGQGSRFWMQLKTGETRPSRVLESSGISDPRSGTVLYVEDEESDVLFVQMAFAAKGLASALHVVGNGRAAIEYLSGSGIYKNRKEYPLPTVVLLDLNLPLVPGFAVLQWMRNHPDFANTPVVIFSSSALDDDRLKARELGANDFVVKPSSGLDFGRMVDVLIEKWLGGREHLSES